jgi:hypothetical protein
MKLVRLVAIFVLCSAHWASDAYAQLNRLGWKPDPAPMMQARLITLGSPPPLPDSVDLTPMLPPPGNQGAQGSCVGWATAYGAKTYHEVVEEYSWDPTSTRFQFSPSWIYNQINGGVDQGSFISAALDLIVADGADTLRFFPYDQWDFTTIPNSASITRARRFEAASWGTLSNNVTKFKQILAGGNAIIVGLSVLPDFDSLDAMNDTYDDDAGDSRGGHAVVITGYDDDREAFSFQNSWGMTWGLNGRGWMAYDFITNTKLGLRAYVLTDGENRDPPWDYNLYIVAGSFLYRVDKEFGNSVHAGAGVWDSATSIASLGSTLYLIQNSRFYRFDPFTNTRTQLGSAVWSGSTNMVGMNGKVYVLRSGVLWHVNHTTGARTQVGTTSWTGATSMTASSARIFIIQGGKLHSIDPTTAIATVKGQTVWTGETEMVAPTGQYLYVVQEGKLWRVNSSTGDRLQRGTLDWNSTAAMAKVGSNVFVIKSGYLYQVDTTTGARDRMTESLWWGNTVEMTSN